MLGKHSDYSFEYAVQWNGQENWVLCEVLPALINKDSRIHGAMISFTDITKFKRKAAAGTSAGSQLSPSRTYSHLRRMQIRSPRGRVGACGELFGEPPPH